MSYHDSCWLRAKQPSVGFCHRRGSGAWSGSVVSRGLSSSSWVAVGLDNGGTSNNATVVDGAGRFLVDRLLETPSRVREGPDVAVEALVRAFELVLEATGIDRSDVRVVGPDTPGPASADGVISSVGSTNFSHPAWPGFDVRGALEAALGAPVVYNNDGNAAALYAHTAHFGGDA